MSEETGMYMVLWDDEMGLCCPMVWNKECAGAIEPVVGKNDEVALFKSRKDARKAISISSKFAALLKAQGEPHCDDFLGESKKFFRIVKCTTA